MKMGLLTIKKVTLTHKIIGFHLTSYLLLSTILEDKIFPFPYIHNCLILWIIKLSCCFSLVLIPNDLFGCKNGECFKWQQLKWPSNWASLLSHVKVQINEVQSLSLRMQLRNSPRFRMFPNRPQCPDFIIH